MFARAGEEQAAREAPLAARMRPRTLDEFVGQEHILGPDRVLRKAIAADRIPSMVLWGPPGSGKTTLARLIAGLTSSHFEALSAVSAGVADLRRAIEEARERSGMYGRRTVLFIDEIHRFNKAQQDAVLPYVEDGSITLIGATTENPSFEVIGPLLSRCRVFTLQALEPLLVEAIIRRALIDEERGLGAAPIEMADETIAALAEASGGDARTALNALELAVQTVPAGPVSPRGPVAPWAPAAPDGPVAPVGPCAPDAPCAPVAPCGPVGPSAPVAPCVPVGPTGPVAPSFPVAPTAPVAPVAPVRPMGPT